MRHRRGQEQQQQQQQHHTALSPTPSEESHLAVLLRSTQRNSFSLGKRHSTHTGMRTPTNPFATRAAGMRCCSSKTAAYWSHCDWQNIPADEDKRALGVATQSYGACAVGVLYTRGMATSRSKMVMWPLRMRSWKKPLMLLRHCSP